MGSDTNVAVAGEPEETTLPRAWNSLHLVGD